MSDTLSAIMSTGPRSRGQPALFVGSPLAAKPRCATWICFSRFLATNGDLAKLAALEAEYGNAPAAIAYSGVVLAHHGRWADAKPKLEAARAHRWERQADLTELDTWLGLARLQANDRDGARAAFEEALRVISIESNGSDGFSYMTPVAERELAKLVDDPPRRVYLERRSVAGFARLREASR